MDIDLRHALRMLKDGVIGLDEFKEALTDWADRPGATFGQVMAERGWISDTTSATIGDSAGERLTDADFGPAHDATGDWSDTDAPGTTHAEGASGERTSGAAGQGPRSPGRYRMLRLHATGGMGQVWVARDERLGRDVALKVLGPRDSPSVRGSARFLEEARITGRIDHPGIVPVYDLGESVPGSDGRCFYTMRFVQGRTLAEAATEFHRGRAENPDTSLDRRNLLTAFVSVCNAVAYAHSRGVIHRDLKGSNVVLGDFGEVIVLDWGLAKDLRRPEDEPGDAAAGVDPRGEGAAERDETVQGQVLGTPAYMAPEQAAGRTEAVGPCSDVYGLGAILYHILTGRAPYEGKSTFEVLRRVREEPPARPQSIAADAPPALEAVCLKAMERDPAARYGSAAELATEVRRWLADEPVSAYPEPWADRLGRWARRHRKALAAAAALAVAAAVALGVGTWRINQERERADYQRLVAEADFGTARQVVNEVLVRLADSGLPDVPRMEAIRRDFAADAVRRYDMFLSQHPDDERLLLEAAQVYRRVSGVEQLTGALDSALGHSRSALAAVDKLIAESPADPEVRSTWASVAIDAGSLLRKHGKPREAEPLLRQGIERADGPDDPQRRVQSFGLISLGYLLRETGRRDEALKTFGAAAARLDAYAVIPRAQPVDVTLSVMALRKKAQLVRESGDPAAAAVDLDAALGRIRAAVKQDENHTDYLSQLAYTLEEKGRLLALDPARESEARSDLDESVALQARLVRDFPRTHHHRAGLVDALFARGALFPDGRDDDLRRCRDLLQTLVAEVPAFPQYATQLGRVLTALGRSESRGGRDVEAQSCYALAVESLVRALKANPDDAIARVALHKVRAETSGPPGNP